MCTLSFSEYFPSEFLVGQTNLTKHVEEMNETNTTIFPFFTSSFLCLMHLFIDDNLDYDISFSSTISFVCVCVCVATPSPHSRWVCFPVPNKWPIESLLVLLGLSNDHNHYPINLIFLKWSQITHCTTLWWVDEKQIKYSGWFFFWFHSRSLSILYSKNIRGGIGLSAVFIGMFSIFCNRYWSLELIKLISQ